MVIEMAIIAFVPLGNATVVFWAWVLNRILSGAAEASASGADEALAYDSLPKEEQVKRWPRILSRLMRLSSIAFIVAMLVGSAVYDPGFVNRLLAWVGSDLVLDKETVLRFPVYLTLATAVGAVFVSLAMKEPPQETECGGESSLWSGILATGKWILRHPFVYALILAALVHDSVVRIFLTTASEYYRLIQIPIAWFGVIGAAFAGIGIFTPRLAEWLVQHRSIRLNYGIVSACTLLGLIGVALAIPIWGVLMAAFFAVGFGLLNFFTSFYLNAEVDSSRRATVLSFRGLALNLGFGALSVVYGGILRLLRSTPADASPEALAAASDNAFRESLFWLPEIFLFLLAGLWLYFFTRVSAHVPRAYLRPQAADVRNDGA